MLVNVTTNTNKLSNIFRHTNHSAAAAELVLLQEPLLLGPILGWTRMVEQQHLDEPKRYIHHKTLGHITASVSSLAFKGAGTETACSQSLKFRTTGGSGAIHFENTVLLDLWQLCEIDEKQYNMEPFIEVMDIQMIKFGIWKRQQMQIVLLLKYNYY